MANGRLRIIAGRWRGRRLTFPAVGGLRPTPDRVRETLFNWLTPQLPGAVCLDLFAGSGALGLEALSRGAGQVTFVERAVPAVRALAANLRLLEAEERAEVIRSDALAFLRRPARPYTVVFLDPPYHRGFLAPACQHLETRGWLAERAWIYVEQAKDEGAPPVPAHWQPYRHTHAGQVHARLYRRIP